jgi:small GTP-binding protein
VVVGDGAVGKTCLLVCFAKDKFPEEYVPTVFENYVKNMNTASNGDMMMDLWDTAGQEDFDRLRPLSYPDTDIVLICYSLVNRRSFENVKEKWAPEIRHYLPNVPWFLVGTKVDLRDAGAVDEVSAKVEPVTRAEGEGLAKDINAAYYLEVSAKTRIGLSELFNLAADTVLSARKGAAAAKAPAAQPQAAPVPGPAPTQPAPAPVVATQTSQPQTKAKKPFCSIL